MKRLILHYSSTHRYWVGKNEQVTGIGITYGSILQNTLQKSDLDFEFPEDCSDRSPYLIMIYSKALSLTYA